ncbi:head-tail connector protein [Aestuariibius insulae]|uniref:head-tail connector protein n=1 Tax=Aestuariibius insulae TaxID=2058287 RepID=UPI00345E7541
MMLTEETAVSAGALPVAQFKDHLRLGTGFGETGLQDGVLESFLRAAIAGIEGRTGKALITRDFLLRLTLWKSPGAQPLPLAPVQEILSVRAVAPDGSEREIAASSLRLEPDAQVPWLMSVSGALPAIPIGGSVQIRLRAGYGASWDALPSDLAQAVLLLAAHYYEYRHETALGDGCMPFGVTALIERYKARRIGRGVTR